MARIQRIASKQKLHEFDIFIEDDQTDSKYFKIIELPKTLSGGKNAFTIAGTEFLELGTNLLVEALDSEGNPLYVEPGKGIPQYYEASSKVVAIYVYEDTPFGIGSVTILGQLREYEDSENVRRTVPDRWKDVYNIRWTTSILIDPLVANETKIRFYRRPIVEITEINKPIFELTSSIFTLDSGSISGEAADPALDSNFRRFAGDTVYRLTLSSDADAKWHYDMVGKTLSVPSLPYSPLIKDILNSKNALANIPYYVESALTVPTTQTIKNFDNLAYSITYISSSIENATSLTSSFANIDIRRLDTFAGDVDRVKIFRKSLNKISDYELILDTNLESKDLLINEDSFNKEERIGYIFDNSHLTSFWTASILSLDPTGLFEYNQSVLQDSVALLDGSSGDGTTALYKFVHKKELPITKGAEYTVLLRVIGLRPVLDQVAKLELYVSGSGVDDSGDGFGKLLETFEVDGNLDRFNFDNINVNFIGDFSGSAKLAFITYYGNWYVSDMSIRASQETAFSPDFVNYLVPMPTDISNETFQFKAEFFDVNSNKIPVLVESDPILFSGGNRVILNVRNESVSQFIFRGTYITGSDYNIDDIVTYGLAIPLIASGSFLLTDDTDPITTPLDSNGNLNSPPWDIFSEGGISGSSGSDGFDGDDGPSGSQGVSGSTGPGLLYIGNHSDLNLTRSLNNNDIAQDSVSITGSSTYYAFIGSDGLSVASSGAPPGGNWSAFTNFSAISTGLLIVENSFVKEVLNIGTNAEGNSANITLKGNTTAPYFSLGQSSIGYDNPGIFIGMESGVPKVSFKHVTAGFIKFDGANVAISSSQFDLKSGNVQLNDSRISLGNLSSPRDNADSSTGFFTNSDGEMLVKAGPANEEYIMLLQSPENVLVIRSSNFDLAAGNLSLSNSRIKIGTLSSVTDVADASTGVYIDSDGNFLAKSGAANTGYIQSSGSALTISSSLFDLKSGNLQINNTFIKIGTLSSATDVADTSTGVYIDSAGDFLAKSGGANTGYIQSNGGDINIKAGTFRLDTTNLDIDSSAKTINLGEGAILIDGSGTPQITIGTKSQTKILSGTLSSFASLDVVEVLKNYGALSYTINSGTEQTRYVADSTSTLYSSQPSYAQSITVTNSDLNFGAILYLTPSVVSSTVNFFVDWYRITSGGSATIIETDSRIGITSNNVLMFPANNGYTHSSGTNHFFWKIRFQRTAGSDTIGFSDVGLGKIFTQEPQSELASSGLQIVASSGEYFLIEPNTSGKSSGNSGIITYIDIASDAEYALHVQGVAAKSSGTTWVNTSDRSVKEKIIDILPSDGISKVVELKPVSFRYKKNFNHEDRNRFGFIAQDYEKVFPEAIHVGRDGLMAMDADDMFAAFTSAIQFLTLKVHDLEKRVYGSSNTPTGSLIL